VTHFIYLGRCLLYDFSCINPQVTDMKKLFAIFLLSLVFSSIAIAQVTDASVCDLLANPASFNGKIVRIKGTVQVGFDEFVIKGSGCNQPVNDIWLQFPEGTKAKSGPLATLQLQLAHNNPAAVTERKMDPITLDQNSKDFKQFDSLLSAKAKTKGLCLGCTRDSVTATLVGRLDGDKQTGLIRDDKGKVTGVGGFGNLNMYPARLVLQSVSDVTAQPIDYSNAETPKDDSPEPAGNGDGFALAHKAATVFPEGSDARKQIERAADAFGKPGEDNGVEVGFGTPNAVSANDKLKGDKSSPDGVLFNCTFSEHLKGNALSYAISHLGSEVADLRDNSLLNSKVGLYELESRSWTTSILNAAAFGQKSLTLPGGYTVWSTMWPGNERVNKLNDGLTKYLTDWAGLKMAQ